MNGRNQTFKTCKKGVWQKKQKHPSKTYHNFVKKKKEEDIKTLPRKKKKSIVPENFQKRKVKIPDYYNWKKFGRTKIVLQRQHRHRHRMIKNSLRVGEKSDLTKIILLVLFCTTKPILKTLLVKIQVSEPHCHRKKQKKTKNATPFVVKLNHV